MDPLILFRAKTRRKPLGIAHKYYTGTGLTDNLTPQTYWYFKILIYIWTYIKYAAILLENYTLLLCLPIYFLPPVVLTTFY
jgi:hypothetical protein